MSKNLKFLLYCMILSCLVLLSSCAFLNDKAQIIPTEGNYYTGNSIQENEEFSHTGNSQAEDTSEAIDNRNSNQYPSSIPQENEYLAPQSLSESGEKDSMSGSTIPSPLPIIEFPGPSRPLDQDSPGNMYFEDYGENSFINTDDDPYSTFAADIDTGSYSITRSYLNQGILPPSESVRVEEFINYFPQGYASPNTKDTFRIFIDGGPTPFTETDANKVIRIGIQGYDIPSSDRKNASLTFVIDVSGSMGNGNRLEMVQESLELLVDNLNSQDSVGIIAYTDSAWVVLPHTSVRHKSEIIDAIYSLYPMASTNVEEGLLLGYQEASNAYLPDGINRVILCSDGVANVGNTGPTSIWSSIEDYAAEGITLTSVGVGMGNYNDVLMEQLADHGDGFYAYVDTLEEAKKLFLYDLTSTLQIIALDAKIQVVFNPEVVDRYRLIGFENRAIADEDFRDNTVDAAEIGAGHTVTALYEIELNSHIPGEIATVQLRWKNPDTYRTEEISKTFDTRDLENSFSHTSTNFQLDVLVAEFAGILKDSLWTKHSSLEDIIEYAQELPNQLEYSEVYEFLDLLEQTSRLLRY